VHIVITLLLLVLIVFLFFRYAGQNASNEIMELSFQTGLNPQMIVPVLIMLLLLTQLSYIINLILGVVRRMN
jgi:F0F1-type ATP synthase assembly protein I